MFDYDTVESDDGYSTESLNSNGYDYKALFSDDEEDELDFNHIFAEIKYFEEDDENRVDNNYGDDSNPGYGDEYYDEYKDKRMINRADVEIAQAEAGC